MSTQSNESAKNPILASVVTAAHATVETTTTTAKRHIVVLDDDDIMLRSVERMLRSAGYKVTATTSPKLAMETVVCESADAIVSDLHMPEMGGNVVLSMLAQAAPRTARLLYTNESQFSKVASLMAPYSVHAFVAKGEVAMRLIPTIEELVSSRPESDEGRIDEEARALAKSIVRALALRDYETEEHCERVAAWSRKLASEMGLSPSRVLDVELGALLHDVGKIGVRDAVLLKPGPLDANEWEEMRKHPDLGVALLSDVPALRRALPVVQCHHERRDGKGYPRQLVGNAIPLAARIFQVVDAYDAIVSDRPYRKGRSDAGSARRDRAARRPAVRSRGVRGVPAHRRRRVAVHRRRQAGQASRSAQRTLKRRTPMTPRSSPPPHAPLLSLVPSLSASVHPSRISFGIIVDKLMASIPPASANTVPATPDAKVNIPRPPATVLVVDEDDDVRESIALALSRAGCKVVQAPDISTARDELGGYGSQSRFDAVLVDSQMATNLNTHGIPLVVMGFEERPEIALLKPARSVEILGAIAAAGGFGQRSCVLVEDTNGDMQRRWVKRLARQGAVVASSKSARRLRASGDALSPARRRRRGGPPKNVHSNLCRALGASLVVANEEVSP